MNPRPVPILDPAGYRRRIIQETEQMIHSIQIGADSEFVLATLVQTAETYADIAETLWNYGAFVAKLLQELISAYRILNKPVFTMRRANHLKNTLTLLRTIAAHPRTRPAFIHAAMPAYVYVFIEMTYTDEPHQIIRTSALSVIAALTEGQDRESIRFLLRTLNYHHVFLSIRIGTLESRIFGMYIFLKILETYEGIEHIAARPINVQQLLDICSFLVDTNVVDRSIDLHSNIVRCYVLLSRHPKFRGSLRDTIPSKLFDNTFQDLVKVYPLIVNGLQLLLQNIHMPP